MQCFSTAFRASYNPTGRLRQLAERTERTLGKELAKMAAEDRLLFRMAFEDGFTVADIARTLGLEQKPLYRRLERLLKQLRAALEAVGIDAVAALELVGFRGSAWSIPGAPSDDSRKTDSCPSI